MSRRSDTPFDIATDRTSVYTLYTKMHIRLFSDIKTGNILLSNDDIPVLMDFGSCCIARQSISDTRISRRCIDDAAELSTMSYRAPELFTFEVGCCIDERSDIWV